LVPLNENIGSEPDDYIHLSQIKKSKISTEKLEIGKCTIKIRGFYSITTCISVIIFYNTLGQTKSSNLKENWKRKFTENEKFN
jgi:hypothetical protein